MIRIFLTLLFLMSSAFAKDTYVNGYYKKNGTYVQPHYRSAPDSTINNNYSTQGNYNPYTGREGTKPRENTYQNSFGNQNKQRNSWNNNY